MAGSFAYNKRWITKIIPVYSPRVMKQEINFFLIDQCLVIFFLQILSIQTTVPMHFLFVIELIISGVRHCFNCKFAL